MTDEQEDDLIAEHGTHFLYLQLPSLALEIRADDGGPDISLGRETLGSFFLTAIDVCASRRDWAGLVVLHACLRRWERYAKTTIQDLEDLDPFPRRPPSLGEASE